MFSMTDEPNREIPMYPATLDHVAAYQSEARRQARLHNAAILAAAPNGSLSRSRLFLRRASDTRRPVPADS
jgi:hypothetical protein